MKLPFLTGSYARADEDGVCLAVLDTDEGTLTLKAAWRGFDNPSYLICDRSGTRLYIVEELRPEGRVVSARLDGDRLTICDRQPSHGADPCHLCLWPDERTLTVCNYTDGSFSVCQADTQGRLTATQTEKLTGGSVHPQRQECAHMHFSAWREGTACLVDLGSDRILLRPADAEHGRILPSPARIELPPGFGPRHLAFGERGMLYVVSELQNRVCVLRPDGSGGYRPIQTVSTLPDGGSGFAAAIRYRDRRLFVSNRGEDSIAMFAVDAQGLLQPLNVCPTGGRTPRDFEVADDHLLVCNQDSSLLTVLKLNAERTSMAPTGLSLALTRPTSVCLLSSYASVETSKRVFTI